MLTQPMRVPDPVDPWTPPTPAATTPTGDGGWLDTVAGWLSIASSDTAVNVASVALAGLFALSVFSKLRRRRNNDNKTTDERDDITSLDRTITRVTAIIATAVVAQGMWVFFAEVLHIFWAFRLVLFSFIEMQMITAVRRTRRYLYRHGNLGNGPWTVVGLAAVTATLAAVHVNTIDERLLRLFAAVVAAHMLIEELREERDILRHREPDKFPPLEKWTDKVRKVAVLLGFAEPTSLAVTEVATQRRIDRLGRLLNHFHAVTADTNPGRFKSWYIAHLERRVIRRTQAACKYINLAEDPKVRAMLLRRLSVVRGIVEATKPGADTNDAWADVTQVDTGDADRERQIIDVTPEASPATDVTVTPTKTATALTPTVIEADIVQDIGVDIRLDDWADTVSPKRVDIGPDMSPFLSVDMLSGSVSGHGADSRPDTRRDSGPDASGDTLTDTRPDAVSTPRPDTRRTSKGTRSRTSDRTSGRTPKWTAQQLKAFKLRDEEEMTFEQISRKLGVATKTISRWFKARAEAEEKLRAAAAMTDVLSAVSVLKQPVTSGVNGHRHEGGDA